MERLRNGNVKLTAEEAVLTQVPAVYELRSALQRMTTDLTALDPCFKAIDDYVYSVMSRELTLREVRAFVDKEPIFARYTEKEKADFVAKGDMMGTVRVILAREADAKLKAAHEEMVSAALISLLSSLGAIDKR
jgi:hypothetical protein